MFSLLYSALFSQLIKLEHTELSSKEDELLFRDEYMLANDLGPQKIPNLALK